MSHTRFAAVTVALLACSGPRLAAAHESARSGPYSLEVVDEAGRVLPTFHHRGRGYVLGSQGARYLLRVRNQTGRRIEVVASVDGRDVIDGELASASKRGYLVQPWGEPSTASGCRTSRWPRFASAPSRIRTPPGWGTRGTWVSSARRCSPRPRRPRRRCTSRRS